MKAALVTATGGHLAELHRLRPRLPGVDEALWITFDSGQTRSLLAGEQTVTVPEIRPRDARRVALNIPRARSILRKHRIDTVISNGSGVALSFIPLAATMGLSCHYIECAARTRGPSLTGALLQRLPRVHCYAQYRNWARGRWHFGGSVLDSFTAVDNGNGHELRHVVVTVGTLFGFGRLVRRLLEILPSDVHVTWQTGPTDLDGLGIEGRERIPAHELQELYRIVDGICRISHLKLLDNFGVLRVLRVATALSLSLQQRRIGMSNKLFGHLIAGALASALALASPALARGGGGGGGMGGGGGHSMGGGGGHSMGGGGGGWGGGRSMGMGGGMGRSMGMAGPMRSSASPMSAHAAMTPMTSRAAFSPAFSHGAFPHHGHFFHHHRFHRFAFFAGGPFYDYAYYDDCWRRVWTSYGPRLVNVCGNYGY